MEWQHWFVIVFVMTLITLVLLMVLKVPLKKEDYKFNMFDWRENAKKVCSYYDSELPPRTDKDCPDSSFSYVHDLSGIVAGAPSTPACIQLGYSSEPFCYSTPSGAYVPWFDKLEVTSP
jgi:hypothetical protein